MKAQRHLPVAPICRGYLGDERIPAGIAQPFGGRIERRTPDRPLYEIVPSSFRGRSLLDAMTGYRQSGLSRIVLYGRPYVAQTRVRFNGFLQVLRIRIPTSRAVDLTVRKP